MLCLLVADPAQLHGRSRQQRYKTKADYAYIAQCAATLRETAADQGLKPIPIFGNGDAYDYRTYYENMEASGVDGIMIARGALVKVRCCIPAFLSACADFATAVDLHRD